MFRLYQVAITLFKKKKKKKKNSTFPSTFRQSNKARVTASLLRRRSQQPPARGREPLAREDRVPAAGGGRSECGLLNRQGGDARSATAGATRGPGGGSSRARPASVVAACPLSAWAFFFFGVIASPGKESQLLHDTGHSASGVSLAVSWGRERWRHRGRASPAGH